MAQYSIGEMSRKTGVKVTTIRFYETRGLLPEPDRTGGGQRRYDRVALERLAFIRHARELGFELPDILDLASLADRPDAACQNAHKIAGHHLDAVTRRIAILNDLREELERMLACDATKAGPCRIIEILGDHRLCKAGTHRKDG